MKAWLYKWLPIICGCHCIDERSFHYKGKRFPVCARCTGELVGIAVSFVTCFFYRPSIVICILLMLPMIADGMIQMFTKYESNNRRRFVTGFLFGYALFMIFAVVTVMAAEFGTQLGREWKNK